MRLLTAADFAVAGRKRIDPIVWDFVEGGAGSEITLEANRRMFDNLEIEPRALVDVSTCDTKSRIFDATLPTPIGIAPTAYHRMVWDEGEIATAQGANGALFIVSIFASCTLEDIAHHATGPLWLQLYWLQQREVLSELVKRASTAGYQAIVLTVDAPRIGRRLRDIRNDFGVPSHIQAVNLDAALMTSAYDADGIAKHARQTFDQTITWSDLEWLKGLSDLPLVLKGVLSPEDADLAIQHGVDAIVVSNHGGRQLDGAVPSLRALPAIVDRVAGRCPVLFDGGVRSGRDVFVALALGATSVLIGRPVLWALAAGGAPMVTSLMGVLNDELENAMALAGRPSIAQITGSALWSR